jgi:hypothetical protein
MIINNDTMWQYAIKFITRLNACALSTTSKETSNFLFDTWDNYASKLNDRIENVKTIIIKEHLNDKDSIEQTFNGEIAIHILENLKNPISMSTQFNSDIIMNWYLKSSINTNYTITIYTSKNIYSTVGINTTTNEPFFIPMALVGY